jgi:hypothetical protein
MKIIPQNSQNLKIGLRSSIISFDSICKKLIFIKCTNMHLGDSLADDEFLTGLEEEGAKEQGVIVDTRPEKTVRPILFFLGLILILAGLFVTIGSVFHNHLMFWVTDTSHAIYGPWDVTAGIIGAVVLLAGVIILILSYRGKSAKFQTPNQQVPPEEA